MLLFGAGLGRLCPHLYDGGCFNGSPNGGDDNGTGRGHTSGGNSSPSPTWAAIKTFFTPPSTGPGSCTAVFLNSIQNSGGNALRTTATHLPKYAQAAPSGLANAGAQAA